MRNRHNVANGKSRCATLASTAPAGQRADEGGVARTDDGPGQHSEGRVLETFVEQGLGHPGSFSVQDGLDRLWGEVPQPEPCAPGGEHQVHGWLTAAFSGVAPLGHCLANGICCMRRHNQNDKVVPNNKRKQLQEKENPTHRCRLAPPRCF